MWKTYLLCIFWSCCYAGYNIVAKISLDKGLSRYALLVYAFAIGTFATGVLAFLLERRNQSKITISILRDIFFLGVIGAVSRILYFSGLEFTSPTFASAMANTLPSITFILAFLFRMEILDVSKRSAQVKIAGTLVALGGATLSTMYKGIVVISPSSRHGHRTTAGTSVKENSDGNWLKGSLLLFISFLSLATFFILQTWTIKKYPAPISLTSLTCLAGTLVAAAMTAILDHKPSSWRLSFDITLLAPIYIGIVIFGVAVYAQTVIIGEKGPVFMTAFAPLSTVIVAIMGLVILGDQLYLGEILGSVLIILGLYVILWAKEFENRTKNSEIIAYDGGNHSNSEK